jgi:hypothetical protein
MNNRRSWLESAVASRTVATIDHYPPLYHHFATTRTFSTPSGRNFNTAFYYPTNENHNPANDIPSASASASAATQSLPPLPPLPTRPALSPSSSSLSRTNTAQKMRHLTNELLDPNSTTTIEIDDPIVWKQLEDVLRWWITTHPPSSSSSSSSLSKQQQQWDDSDDNNQYYVANTNNDNDVDEGIKYCIRLIDKFASILPQEDLLFVGILETSLLNTILSKWKKRILLQHRHHANASSSIVVQKNSHAHDGSDTDRVQSRTSPTMGHNYNNRSKQNGRSSSLLIQQQGHHRHQQQQQQQQQLLWSPSIMAGKLEHYRWSAIVQPDAWSFNLVLHAMMRIEGVKVADQYLHSLLQVAVQQEIAMRQVTGLTSSSSASSSASSSSNTETHLQQQQSQRQQLPLPPMADIVSVNTVLKGWVDTQCPQRAQKWLDRIIQLQPSSSNSTPSPQNDNSSSSSSSPTIASALRPNSVSYSRVLQGWAQQGYAEQAEWVLQQQINDYCVHKNDTAQVDRISFHMVLDSWIKAMTHKDKQSRRPNNNNNNNSSSSSSSSSSSYYSELSSIQAKAPARARLLVQQMKDLARLEQEVPCNRNDNDADDLSSETSNHNNDRNDSYSVRKRNPSTVSPNFETMSLFLVVLAHSSKDDLKDAVAMLLELEQESEQRASIIVYNRFLHAYAQKELPDEAETFLLDHLLSRGEEPPSHSSKSNNNDTIDKGHNNNLKNMNDIVVRPDIITFNCILSAWASVAENQPHAVLKCEGWLKQMTTDYGVLPTVESYSVVLNAWRKSTKHYDDAAERAEQLYHTMFSEVVHAYNGGRDHERMILSTSTTTAIRHSSSSLDPSSFDAIGISKCFHTVLKAWDFQIQAYRRQQTKDVSLVNCRRAGTRALEFFYSFFNLIQHQEKLPFPLRSLLKPHHEAFKTALYIIAFSGLTNKYTLTMDVLKFMKEYGIKPTKEDLQLIDRLTNKNGNQQKMKRTSAAAAATTTMATNPKN